ncbi:HEPN domain-containing protein [Pseudomonas sp. 3-2]|uniref:HEPN domain-containing protein n=1 Tax=Pseudomonas sp. 3-2 TaxID=2867408 RepID=UPI001C88CDF3|nr:HEPN domain-containing protein [Pseudomonas sp. 3-2]QZD69437.1 hypothetical protein K3819_19570 [Pseudomonas sp. 3-2]
MNRPKENFFCDAFKCFVLNPEVRALHPKTYFFGRDAISITSSENFLKYDDALEGMLTGEIGERISKKFLSELVSKRVYSFLKESKDVTDGDGRKFKEELKNLPLRSMRVIREIYGASINDSPEALMLGRFKFYDWNRHKHLIAGLDDEEFSLGVESLNHNILIECVVKCHDRQKAQELGNYEFLKFENIIRFWIGRRLSQYQVEILDYKGFRTHTTYIGEGESLGFTVESRGTNNRFNLCANLLSAPGGAMNRLINLEEKTANNLERKILKSVEWLGQALAEQNAASAFIKTSTALEVLFSKSKSGVISSSLMATFSEACAQILGNDSGSCLLVEQEIKNFYGIRSAVVHSGKSDVSIKELNKFIAYVRDVILRLLGRRPYCDFKSIDELTDYLSRLKYMHKMVVGPK